MLLQILSLVIGLIGSIGGFLWLKDRYIHIISNKRFNKIFRISNSNRTFSIIIPTQESIESLPYIPTTYEDSISESIAQVIFFKNGVIAKTLNHSKVNEDKLSSNLLLICGPANNSITKKIISNSKYKFPFNFKKIKEEWWIVDLDNEPVHIKPIVNKVDYSIIARVKNPWAESNSNCNVFLCAGIYGIGTWGSSSFLFNQSNKLFKRLKLENINFTNDNFCILLKTEKSKSDLISSKILLVEKF